MLLDKLTLINNALIATGNEPVTTDDGSDQWIAASTAYDRMLLQVLYKHNWTFQTATIQLTRLGASTYPGYADIFQKPADCLHLENVWRTDLALMVQPLSGFRADGGAAMPPPLDYKIIGDQIHCYAPNGVTALYLIDPTQHAGVILDVTPGIHETLTREVESLLYQGLNEDDKAAITTKKLAAEEISEARSKADSEMPRRVPFRSGFLEKRRVRRVGGWF